MFEAHFVEEWDPSDAEFDRYLKREAELAKENVSLLRALFGHAALEDTLHCRRAFFEGFQAALADKSRR